MAWTKLSDLADLKRRAVMRRIVGGQVPSYVNERGERMVWQGGELEPFWALDLVAKVRDEVANLRRGANQASAQRRRRRRRAA